MSEKLARIKAMGFSLVGCWTQTGDEISFDLAQEVANSPNALYAFVAGGEVMYVGKTIQALRKRIGDYRHPTRPTSKKNKSRIQQCLAQGKAVEIFVLPDNGLLYYGGFHVNLAAGLEDSLIRDLKPRWNGGMRESDDGSEMPIAPA